MAAPMLNELKFPGVQRNSDGTIDFSLTDDEAREADQALSQFKGYLLHPECAERVRNGTIAVALSQYAQRLVVAYHPEIVAANGNPTTELQSVIVAAIAAVWKSYSLYPLPIFTFHRGSFFFMLGLGGEARRLFSLFLKQHAAFTPDEIDESVMQFEGFDIERAISTATR